MKKEVLVLIIVATFTLLTFQSCEDEGNESKISSFGSSESHKTGQNCMICHISGGNGGSWFTVAGTVTYNPILSSIQQSTVKLYTGANETKDLITTIEVDEKGNFYTTKKVDFGTGLYVSVEGNTTTQNMVSSIANGKCNSCHGVNTDAIWVE